MEHANIDMIYKELVLLHKEVEKNNVLLLGLIPEEKVSKTEMDELKKIKAEMDAGKKIPYSKDLF